MINAHQLSRACRDPGYSVPGPSAPPPPAFMVAPTTCARGAVRLLHTEGAIVARTYLAQSKVGEWTGHGNRSMASGANAVIDGFNWYIANDAADGRAFRALDQEADISLPTGPVTARLDVVLDDGTDVAGRVVLWDGPDFDDAIAPVMAYPFADALQQLFPATTVTTIGIWQARRQRRAEIPYAAAIAQAAAADAILARL